MSFDLDPDYKQVPERIAELKAVHPDAVLRPVNPDKPFDVVTMGDRAFIVYAAACYRDPTDQLPAIGVAWEPFPGRTPYTKDSELQNAETSAWGRAIVASLRSESKAVASAEDVRNRRADQEHGDSPVGTAPAAPRTPPSAPRPQASGSGVPCPTDGCAGHLVQRATKTGKNPGSPYLVCDTGKNGCGLQPIWDATLEDYATRMGRETDGDVDPDEIPASLAASVPPKVPELSLSQQIAELVKENTQAGIRAAFESVPGASACLAMMPNGSWRIRGTELGALSDEAKQELVAKLSATAEISF